MKRRAVSATVHLAIQHPVDRGNGGRELFSISRSWRRRQKRWAWLADPNINAWPTGSSKCLHVDIGSRRYPG